MKSEDAGDWDRVKVALPALDITTYRLRYDAASAWILVEADLDSLPEDVPVRLSLNIDRAVIGWQADGASDGFRYVHVVDGRVRRRFDYGMAGEEREWNTLEGDPEAWEADVFFGDEEKTAQLDGCDEEDTAEIEGIYAKRALRLGSRYPLLGGLGMLQIPDALGLPGAIVAPTAGWTRDEQVSPPGFFARIAALVSGRR